MSDGHAVALLEQGGVAKAESPVVAFALSGLFGDGDGQRICPPVWEAAPNLAARFEGAIPLSRLAERRGCLLAAPLRLVVRLALSAGAGTVWAVLVCRAVRARLCASLARMRP